MLGGVRTVLLQMAAGSLGLLLAALWPRPDRPVLLAFASVTAASGAFAAPGWRVQRLEQLGPFAFTLLTPEAAGANPAALRAATGAFLALAGWPGAGCAPSLAEP